MTTTTKSRLQSIALVVARIVLGYLFLTQLFWKAPPSFGCPPDFSFTTGTLDGGRVRLQRTSGLCDWVGIESVYAQQPRPFLVLDATPVGGPRLSLGLGWLARLNGLFIDNVIIPGFPFTGWLIWLAEAFIAGSLLLGLFTRLGGLVALAISAQLMVGLAGIPNPYEWEWSYNLMVLLSLVVFATAPGTILGLDALVKPRLQTAAEKGNRLARLLTFMTSA
ncbi:hypothetical protein ACFLZW_04180 [Chloroflexota bacterium]